jgi:hypothetical protein
MAQTFYFSEDAEILKGNTVNTSLYVNTSTLLGSVQLEILFNSSVIQAEDVIFSVSNAIFEKTIDNQTGKITIGIISLSGVASGKIADLIFRGIAVGTTPLNISIVDLTDTVNNPLSGSASNSTVRVTTMLVLQQNYTLSLPHINLTINQTTQIPVSIFAPTNITGINFTLLYNPSIIQIVDAETLLPSQLYTNIDNTNGTARFALILNNSISGEANILNLIVNATSPGHTDLIISGAEMSGEDFNVTPVKSFNGSVTVLSLKGDINGDGSINIADVTLVAYMVVGKVQPDLKADFNGNGRVDVGDLAKIAYYLLGKISEL